MWASRTALRCGAAESAGLATDAVAADVSGDSGPTEVKKPRQY